MINPRLIKKRVGAIKNIGKITKALEMVAASKVQKAQTKAANAKPFALKVYELVQSLAGEKDVVEIPLMKIPVKIENELYILISTNRGLAGSLNTNLFRSLNTFLEGKSGVNYLFATVGKKGRNFAAAKGNLLADFSETLPFEASAPQIVKLATGAFIEGKADSVYLVFNDFISALNQEPKIKKLLPITKEELLQEAGVSSFEVKGKFESGRGLSQKVKEELYNYEPSPFEVLSQLLPFYLEIEVMEAIIEAEASEHSARMIAMKSASDNASELTDSLSLEYNKARQSLITGELSDITVASLTLQ